MCGFVAVIGTGGKVEAAVLNAMRDRLHHRGPDGEGSWSRSYEQGAVSLGFRRLAILDLRDAANQPMVSDDGKIVLVFNGEIYNFVELRRELEQAGQAFRTSGDTEVLLRAYEHWGDEAIHRLNGMFAFLIWDERKGTALIARDRFGEKPLYFCRLANGAIALASEIKALFAHLLAPCSLDTMAMANVLDGDILFGKERTLFEGVEQFRAAYVMHVTIDGRVTQYRRYWQPNYDRALEGVPRPELIAAFADHLERSISMRTRSDVPLGANLSGGVDSSGLVGLLSGLARDGQIQFSDTISARFPSDPTVDEGPYIDLMLAHCDLAGISVTPSPEDLIATVKKLHWHQEAIVAGASMFLEWAVFEKAKECGLTVMIDGQGADEIVAGYSIYLQAYQADLYARGNLVEALEVGRRRDDLLMSEFGKYENAKRRIALCESLGADELAGFHVNHMASMRRLFGLDGMPSAVATGPLRSELALNVLYTSLPSNTFSGDRNSMAHGIECRYPYLDYELVDFCCSLPDWALIDDGWSKAILRHVLQGAVPDAIRWRVDKVGFMGPFDKWWQTPLLQEWLTARISDGLLEAIPGFDQARARQSLDLQLNGNIDLSGELWRYASAAEMLALQRDGEWRDGLADHKAKRPELESIDAAMAPAGDDLAANMRRST